MIQNFSQKLSKLPSDIQDILLAEHGRKIEDDIISQYQLVDNDFIIETLVNLLFFGELRPSQLAGEIEKKLKITPAAAQKVALDIMGRRMLAADDYFKGEMKREMEKLGGRPDGYADYVRQIKEAVEREKSGAENEPVEEVRPSLGDYSLDFEFKDLPPEQEKSSSIQVFHKGLVYFLDQVSPELAELFDDYNKRLILFIGDDTKFKTNLEQALYENIDLLTEKKITTAGRIEEPTVSAWLKDFIAANGSGNFTNVVLSQYLANSANAKALNSEEKKRLSKLLVLYRNLKFFPGSMENLPPEKWGIIPIEISRESAETIITPVEMGDEAEFDESSLTPLELKALGEQKNKSDRI